MPNERQGMYGFMKPNPPIKSDAPAQVPCSKCGGVFILEKTHKEVYVVPRFYARVKKTGSLTPSTPRPERFYRLCPGCDEKLKAWFATK